MNLKPQIIVIIAHSFLTLLGLVMYIIMDLYTDVTNLRQYCDIVNIIHLPFKVNPTPIYVKLFATSIAQTAQPIPFYVVGHGFESPHLYEGTIELIMQRPNSPSTNSNPHGIKQFLRLLYDEW